MIHHSDQGSQYTSIEFGHRCGAAGARPSMGSIGDAYDNRMCESFFATLECELLDRRRAQLRCHNTATMSVRRRGLRQKAPGGAPPNPPLTPPLSPQQLPEDAGAARRANLQVAGGVQGVVAEPGP